MAHTKTETSRAQNIFQYFCRYDSKSVTPETCKEACSGLHDPTVEVAGITQQKVCICGRNPDQLVEDLSGRCDANDNCPGGGTGCGGSRGRYRVYVVDSNKPTKLELTVTEDAVRKSSGQ